MDSDLPLYKTTLDLSYYSCAEEDYSANTEFYTKNVTWSMLMAYALRGSGAMGTGKWWGRKGEGRWETITQLHGNKDLIF